MTSMVYYHKVPPSLESRLIQIVMGLFGMKRTMELRIVNNKYSKEPAKIPKSFVKKFDIEIEEYEGKKVWTISPRNSNSNSVILFLHGGAYYANITPMHWQLIGRLIAFTNAKFIVPDYPLAPESTCRDTYQFLDVLYAKLISKHPNKQFIFMGDSAGGGLGLGYAQKIRNENIKQPEQIILFSPWLDVSMTNPEIAKYDRFDKVLSINGLKIAGENYADELDVTDFRVSPIFGNFANLGSITIFIGTNEIFIADARKLMQLLESQNINFNYFEYPGMFHDWVVVPNLKETKDVLVKIKDLFKLK